MGEGGTPALEAMKKRFQESYQEELRRQRENADQIGPLCLKRAKIRKGGRKEFRAELGKHLQRVGGKG